MNMIQPISLKLNTVSNLKPVSIPHFSGMSGKSLNNTAVDSFEKSKVELNKIQNHQNS